MESFPWTRLAGTVVPSGSKAEIELPLPDDPAHDDDDMRRIWAVGVDETRSRIESL